MTEPTKGPRVLSPHLPPSLTSCTSVKITFVPPTGNFLQLSKCSLSWCTLRPLHGAVPPLKSPFPLGLHLENSDFCSDPQMLLLPCYCFLSVALGVENTFCKLQGELLNSPFPGALLMSLSHHSADHTRIPGSQSPASRGSACMPHRGYFQSTQLSACPVVNVRTCVLNELVDRCVQGECEFTPTKRVSTKKYWLFFIIELILIP